MSAQIVQVNFRLNISAAEWDETARSLTQPFAELPGLAWKIWMVDEHVGEAGGVYMFVDEEAAQAFLDGPLAAQVAAAPFLRDLEVKRFAVMEYCSRATRAPLPALTST